MLTQNAPVASALVTLSFGPSDENMTKGGLPEIALKQEYGARLCVPFGPMVEIHPIGRGTTSASHGFCGSP